MSDLRAQAEQIARGESCGDVRRCGVDGRPLCGGCAAIADAIEAFSRGVRDAERQKAETWKRAWETATHDDCLCPVNAKGIVDPACPVHGAASSPRPSGEGEGGRP